VPATLVFEGPHAWLENLFVVVKQETGTPVTTNGVVQAKEGDEVPNFTLLNQDGKHIRLNNYRGKTLLLTFIYTRCPFPDQCTLMSNNFAQIELQLGQDPELYARTHLLSISIDPTYDEPKVLRSYGAAHTERYEKETFAHWEFATGTGEQVKEIAQYFGLTYFPEQDQIIHALRTAVIGPDGKIVKLYAGNEWKVDEVLHELRKSVFK
jgi:protein SCO1/2